MYIKLGQEKSPIDQPYDTFESITISIECLDGFYSIRILVHLFPGTMEI
jgi:hypothetical protein